MTKIFATVSLTTILAHNPCDKGLSDFKAKFGHLDPDTPVPLLSCLESNYVPDVIWALRAVHQDISAIIPLIAADFAESALHIFEKKFQGDDRPRKAIEAARSGDKEEARHAARAADDAYTTAHDAAYTADDAAANAAAAAYHAAAAAAAAPTAEVSTFTIFAASYAADAVAFTSFADAERSRQAETLRKYFTDKE